MKDRLENQLLHASLLCGLIPGGRAAHRLQIIFVANKELSSSNHQSDFQRALESGVDKSEFWENWPERGSGEYRITHRGYEKATTLFGHVVAKYSPQSKSSVNFTLKGQLGNIHVLYITRACKSEIYLDNKKCESAKRACDILEKALGQSIRTTGDSAARVLYNLAIDNGFEMIWGA